MSELAMASATTASAASTDELVDLLSGRIQRGEIDLPMLPRAAAEVVALATTPDADSRQLATLVREDPALTSAVLRYVNSAAVRGAVPIASVQQAIGRAGMSRVRDIALAVSVKGELFASREHADLLSALWRRALATAAWAREIARARRASVDAAYLAGLLHNVGDAVIVYLVVQLRAPVSQPVLADLAERLAPMAGIALAARWQLPEAVANVIAHWRDATTCDANSLTVAGAVACAGWGEGGGDDVDALATLPGVARLEFYPDELSRLAGNRDAVASLIETLA